MSKPSWVADENRRIFEAGRYLSRGRGWIDMSGAIDKAIHSARLYRPDELVGLLKKDPVRPGGELPRIDVVEGKTGATGRWLAEKANGPVAVLNFASARNAGGGYRRGARAQEEDLCRCSALYPTLLKQPDYYTANRNQNSLLYTDHIIYSDAVPFFRNEKYEYLERPVPLSVITAPAPNAGEFLRREPTRQMELEQAVRRRAGMVLAVAEDQGIRNLVLGAWGCGVFQNGPEVVADAFGRHLESTRFRGSFDRIVFGIYAGGLPGQVSLEVFGQRFGER